VLSKSAR